MNIRIAVASIVIALAAVGSLYFVFAKEPAYEESARVFEAAPEVPFRFEMADSPEERVQGLSGRRDVPSNYGLLFVFEEAGSPGFWMKDMQGQPARFFVNAPRALSIATDFSRFGADIGIASGKA